MIYCVNTERIIENVPISEMFFHVFGGVYCSLEKVCEVVGDLLYDIINDIHSRNVHFKININKHLFDQQINEFEYNFEYAGLQIDIYNSGHYSCRPEWSYYARFPAYEEKEVKVRINKHKYGFITTENKLYDYLYDALFDLIRKNIYEWGNESHNRMEV